MGFNKGPVFPAVQALTVKLNAEVLGLDPVSRWESTEQLSLGDPASGFRNLVCTIKFNSSGSKTG